jgi:hypothetical protein
MKLFRNTVEQDLEAIDLHALSIETITLVNDLEQFVDELYDKDHWHEARTFRRILETRGTLAL